MLARPRRDGGCASYPRRFLFSVAQIILMVPVLVLAFSVPKVGTLTARTSGPHLRVVPQGHDPTVGTTSWDDAVDPGEPSAVDPGDEPSSTPEADAEEPSDHDSDNTHHVGAAARREDARLAVRTSVVPEGSGRGGHGGGGSGRYSGHSDISSCWETVAPQFARQKGFPPVLVAPHQGCTCGTIFVQPRTSYSCWQDKPGHFQLRVGNYFIIMSAQTTKSSDEHESITTVVIDSCSSEDFVVCCSG